MSVFSVISVIFFAVLHNGLMIGPLSIRMENARRCSTQSDWTKAAEKKKKLEEEKKKAGDRHTEKLQKRMKKYVVFYCS